MIQETVKRLFPLAPPTRFWVITNEHYSVRSCASFRD